MRIYPSAGKNTYSDPVFRLKKDLRTLILRENAPEGSLLTPDDEMIRDQATVTVLFGAIA